VPLFSGDVVRSIPGFCQPVSSLSHLLAAGVALALGLRLVSLARRARGSRHRVFAVSVYVCCVVTTLGISGAYHSLAYGCSARTVMQRMDYFAIWLLIAGTFTAIHGVMFKGRWRRGMLTFIWSYVGVAVALQSLWFDIFSGVAGLVLYLGLGWFGLFSVLKLGRQLGFRAVRPIWHAGIMYAAGAILEATGHPVLVDSWVGPHEIFHVAVIAGVALHWSFIKRLLTAHPPALTSPTGLPTLQVDAA
jgi:channel protein (hemolysin III family)